MSAIRKLIRGFDGVAMTPHLREELNAAEAELKELDEASKTLAAQAVSLQLQLAQRDRADAELLEAWRACSVHNRPPRKGPLAALARWAAAKGGQTPELKSMSVAEWAFGTKGGGK